jgi:light-regulated signal transduction histidine kinase (bacteriophytochrome)
MPRHYRERLKKFFDIINTSAQKMGTLIDDLLNFSRTGRAELKKSRIMMKKVVTDSIAEVVPSSGARKVKWDIKPLPAVFGDYNLLKIVWVNLIDNAYKYTRKNESAEISIGYTEEKETYNFYIKDNGVGFDMKYAQKLFGVFQRMHSEAEFEGTGIGLANVRRIIHRHGGNTWAEAEQGKGASFYFSLPKQTIPEN